MLLLLPLNKFFFSPLGFSFDEWSFFKNGYSRNYLVVNGYSMWIIIIALIIFRRMVRAAPFPGMVLLGLIIKS
jgi:hypothetical protein